MHKRIAALFLVAAAFLGLNSAPALAAAGYQPVTSGAWCAWHTEGYMDSTNHIVYYIGKHATNFHDGDIATCGSNVPTVQTVWWDAWGTYPITMFTSPGTPTFMDNVLPMGGMNSRHFGVHLMELQKTCGCNTPSRWVWKTVATLDLFVYRNGS